MTGIEDSRKPDRIGGQPEVVFRPDQHEGLAGPSDGVFGMAANPPDLDAVRLWVERSCANQDVPVKVTGMEAIERAAALLREGRRPHRRDLGPSPPDQVDP